MSTSPASRELQSLVLDIRFGLKIDRKKSKQTGSSTEEKLRKPNFFNVALHLWHFISPKADTLVRTTIVLDA